MDWEEHLSSLEMVTGVIRTTSGAISDVLVQLKSREASQAEPRKPSLVDE
jgi:hypothetical protein